MLRTFSILLRGAALFAAFLAVFFTSRTVHALTITPIRAEVAADPGQTLIRELTLYNERDTAETFYTSFANFEAQGDTGNPAFVDPTGDLGTWIEAEPTVVIPARSSKTVSYTISVPEDAEPGGHFAAIFWGTTPKAGEGQVSIGAKTGFLVLLSVSGPISEKGGIVDFSTAGSKTFYTSLPVGFSYRFENGGSDRIKPDGDIVIRNMLGLVSERFPGNPVGGNVLPRSVRRFEPAWEGKDALGGEAHNSGFFGAAKREWRNFAFGRYVATLDLAYGTQAERSSAKTSFWVIPWHLLVLVITGGALLVFLARFAAIRYNRWVIGKAEHLLEEQMAKQRPKGIIRRIARKKPVLKKQKGSS